MKTAFRGTLRFNRVHIHRSVDFEWMYVNVAMKKYYENNFV